ncbi:FAS1-like dehydratase domain-containing protein [Nocardia vermiculata]|uniref:FAS1-like dehydratase domain-containing protein n=1 Tax=Nocardia vermiculata TaxID=257274 RepID=A0A846Y2N9_9NOCA|nr:MaoC family dehydratase N-terminal domain-containing protein [Nocardia vermiculata]NKY52230.1 hypothetical protein [Nocardia vermiculata]
MVSATVDVPPVAPLHGEHRFRSRSDRPIAADTIRAYAATVGAADAIHDDEHAAAARGFGALVAPSSFATTVWMRAEARTLNALIPGFHSGCVVHADRTLDIVRPLLAGDRIGCEIGFESFRHYRDYAVISVTTVLHDHQDRIVSTGSSTLLVHTPPDSGYHETECRADDLEPLPLRRRLRLPRQRVRAREPRPLVDVGSLSVGTVLPGDTVTVAADQARRDAGAASTVPGMLTLGLLSEYLGRWLGDPTALTKLQVQYTPKLHYLPVTPGMPTPIRFGGRVGRISSRRRMVTVAVDALSKGRKLFGCVSAEARLG